MWIRISHVFHCLCAVLSPSVLGQVNPDDEDNYHRMLELWFLFCLIWSLGASVDEDSRKKMDNFIREIEGQFPSKVHTLIGVKFVFTN